MNNWRIKAALIMIPILGVVALLSACKPLPPCLKSHTTVIMMPVMIGKVTTLQARPVFVCDQYCARRDVDRRCDEYSNRMNQWEKSNDR